MWELLSRQSHFHFHLSCPAFLCRFVRPLCRIFRNKTHTIIARRDMASRCVTRHSQQANRARDLGPESKHISKQQDTTTLFKGCTYLTNFKVKQKWNLPLRTSSSVVSRYCCTEHDDAKTRKHIVFPVAIPTPHRSQAKRQASPDFVHVTGIT